MNIESINAVYDFLTAHDNYLISAHVNPEGDSICSQLAMQQILENMGKKSVIVNNHMVPDNLRFLPDMEKVLQDLPDDFTPEAFVILDCPVKERTGHVCNLIRKELPIINIDHHVSNEYFADVNWVDPEASSVGQMIYQIAKFKEIPIDTRFAIKIYTAIVTDTGMFNYDNTSSETHIIAADLIDHGVKPKVIHSNIFESKSIEELRLLGKGLTSLEEEFDGILVHMSLTREMYQNVNSESTPTDEFINFPRSVKKAKIAVLFKETNEKRDFVKASFRSVGNIDVNKLASSFGGGGHPHASGCSFHCGLEEAKKKVFEAVGKIIQESN